MQLGSRDYRAVLELVGDAHDAATVDELRALLLPALRRMVPAEYISYNEISEDGEALFTLADPELPDWAYAAWGRHAGENPLVARIERTRDSRPYQWADVVDEAEFRRSPIFKELYARLGIDHQIAFALPSSRRLTIGLALSRARLIFTEAEREMLDLARPHLIQAYRNAQTRGELSSMLNALPGALDQAGQGVVLVSADGEVALASEKARALAERAGETPLEEGEPLPAGLAAVDGTATLALESDDAVLVRRVSGLATGTTVLLLEPVSQALSASSLAGLGLTAREAEVLARLARGLETSALADELGLSVRTVHKHSQAIHAKLGVRSRAQAVATAWAATGLRSDA